MAKLRSETSNNWILRTIFPNLVVSNIPECWEEQRVTRVLCLAAVFAFRGAPSQFREAVASSHPCVMSAFTNTHPQKHTRHNKARTINLLQFDFTSAFILLSSDLWTGILKNKHTLTLKRLTFDLWGYSTEETMISLRKCCVLMWPQKVVTVWDGTSYYSSFDIKEVNLSPDHPKQALNPYLILFYSLQVRHGHFHFLPTHKRPATRWSLSLNMPATVADWWDRRKAAL